jgi:putative restriction endonuclease
VWRYRLLRATVGAEGVVDAPPPPPGSPPRVQTTVQRVVRSTPVAQAVKRLHENCCQICGEIVRLRDGLSYSEAAHIRPLGLPDEGPDVAGNVLCLCPNDHVRFDRGAIYVDETGVVIDAEAGEALGPLRLHGDHLIDPAQLEYHRERWTLL